MRLYLTPVRMDASLSLARYGTSLHINGEVFDFSPLARGQILPPDAVQSDWIVGPVSHDDRGLRVVLRLPYGPEPEGGTPPQPIELKITKDGPIDISGIQQETYT